MATRRSAASTAVAPAPARNIDDATRDSTGDEGKGKSGVRARDEVFAEIHDLLETNATLQLGDFDYRIRQHLHAMLGSGGRTKLHAALQTINTATARKPRREVKNWPAYLRKLLTKFDEQEREARAKALAEQAATESTSAGSDTSSKSSTPDELSEEDEEVAWMQALDQELREEDKWLNDLLNVEAAESKPPPPPETPPPQPKDDLAVEERLSSQWDSLKGPLLSMAPPGLEDVPRTFLTPVKAAVPPTVGSLLSHTADASSRSTMHAAAKLPPPPACPPSSYLAEVALPQMAPPATPADMRSQALRRQYLQQQWYAANAAGLPLSAEARGSTNMKQMPNSLDFPLDAWSAWLRFPQARIAAN